MSLKRIYASEKKVYAAYEELVSALDEHFSEAVINLSIQRPGKTVDFISAMGTFFVTVRDQAGRSRAEMLYETEIRPPFLQLLQRIREDLGWNAVPAPLWLSAIDGELTRKTDW